MGFFSLVYVINIMRMFNKHHLNESKAHLARTWGRRPCHTQPEGFARIAVVQHDKYMYSWSSSHSVTTFQLWNSVPVRMKLFLNLLGLLLVAGNASAGKYLGYISPYSFDANYFHAPTWMTALPDSTNLTSLSIPGTHDTITNAVNGPVAVIWFLSYISYLPIFYLSLLYQISSSSLTCPAMPKPPLRHPARIRS